MAKRLQKTLLDYLVIAISPAMIMVLIDSLALFLIEVFYRGGYEGRIEYAITLFVIGAVLIGRISIEEGRERAILFAGPLGIAILLVICTFVEFKGALAPFSFFINVGLIALIWWSANKLTWDCTLIDEREEDSGEGLLETVGLDKPDHEAMQREIAPTIVGVGAEVGAAVALPPPKRKGRGGSTTATPSEPAQIEATTSRDGGPMGWWDRFVERRRRPHAPGVWVVYFSLAALPLFGLGQLFIPNNKIEVRQYAFQLLFVYTASGLGLLLSTSFLGLRRYLRQRRQVMPLQMVNLWLGIGVALIAVVMFAAMLLPRPNAEYAISDLPFHVGSPEQHSSRYGTGQEGVEEDQPDARLEPRDDAKPDAPQSDQPGDIESPKGRSSDAKSTDNRQSPSTDQKEADKRGESGDAKKSKSDKSSGKQSDSREKQPANDKAKGKDGNSSDRDAEKRANPSQDSGTAKVKPPDESAARREGRRSPSSTSPRSPSVPRLSFSHAFPSLGTAFKWLLYLALAVLVIWAAWKNRAELLAALRDFRQMLADLWNRLFGGKPREAAAAAAEEAAKQKPLPRFSDYKDPFAAGVAARYRPEEIVRYTFEALEAWGRDTGHPRLADQTPHEFARCLGAETSSLAADAGYLAELYCHVAYAHATPAASSVGRLAQLWQEMRAAITQQAVPTPK